MARSIEAGGWGQGFALLKNVSIWYELWRQINGFPPEFYQPSTGKEKTKVKK